MKKIVLILISVIGTVSLASASNIFSYTATAGPGTAHRMEWIKIQTPVNVWTEVLYPWTTGMGDGTVCKVQESISVIRTARIGGSLCKFMASLQLRQPWKWQ